MVSQAGHLCLTNLLAFFEETKKGVDEYDPADNINLEGRKFLKVFPRRL